MEKFYEDMMTKRPSVRLWDKKRPWMAQTVLSLKTQKNCFGVSWIAGKSRAQRSNCMQLNSHMYTELLVFCGLLRAEILLSAPALREGITRPRVGGGRRVGDRHYMVLQAYVSRKVISLLEPNLSTQHMTFGQRSRGSVRSCAVVVLSCSVLFCFM